MNSRPGDESGLDELLKKVLADDLPADVEAGLRERIARWRAGTKAREEERAEGRGRLRWRVAWAAASVLMLVSGSLLQGLGPRSSLAERISSVMTKVSEIESTHPTGAPPAARIISPERRPASIPEDKEKSR